MPDITKIKNALQFIKEIELASLSYCYCISELCKRFGFSKKY